MNAEQFIEKNVQAELKKLGFSLSIAQLPFLFVAYFSMIVVVDYWRIIASLQHMLEDIYFIYCK